MSFSTARSPSWRRRRPSRAILASVVLAAAALPLISIPAPAMALCPAGDQLTDDCEPLPDPTIPPEPVAYVVCAGDPFNEGVYLERYPDVAGAVARGEGLTSGCHHYAITGRREGRTGTGDGQGFAPWNPPAQSPIFACSGTPFSESTYLARNGDVAAAVTRGEVSSGCQHFTVAGHLEGRSGTPDGWTPPRVAVALGDSFISGEGAGAYAAVRNTNGALSGFPGWTGDNRNAYFCHRSQNASIEVAQLNGIDARRNLACSGGRPFDISRRSVDRDRGRDVTSQLAQLRAVATTDDIDVALIGLGSNNSTFTFGDAATDCVQGFLSDAFFGFTRPLLDIFTKKTLPAAFSCSDAQFPSEADVQQAEEETYQALRQVVLTLQEVDTDGSRRIVLQDYTNPLPEEFHPTYHSESSCGRGYVAVDIFCKQRTDEDDKFRGLASERYEAGCPIHRRSLPVARRFSERLGQLVAANVTRLRAEFPQEDIVYLNVQSAFDGARLCETTGTSLATPARAMAHPDGNYRTTLNGLNKLHLEEMANTCNAYFQTCQEGWHPNADGHQVLGQCLTLALANLNADSTFVCSRNRSTGTISGARVAGPE